MKKVLGIMLGLALSLSGNAYALTISDSSSQSGFSGYIGGGGASLATYDFSSTSYSSLTSIDSMTINITMWDGDTASGNFDFNKLYLKLDGIDTGLILNGFRNNRLDTLTFTWAPINGGTLLTSLLSDGILTGRIHDLNFTDNDIWLPGSSITTLSITGQTASLATPEPSSMILLGSGLVGLAGWKLRRKQQA
jgi:hypothetical protein